MLSVLDKNLKNNQHGTNRFYDCSMLSGHLFIRQCKSVYIKWIFLYMGSLHSSPVLSCLIVIDVGIIVNTPVLEDSESRIGNEMGKKL